MSRRRTHTYNKNGRVDDADKRDFKVGTAARERHGPSRHNNLKKIIINDKQHVGHDVDAQERSFEDASTIREGWASSHTDRQETTPITRQGCVTTPILPNLPGCCPPEARTAK